VVKRPKARLAEQRYIKRARDFIDKSAPKSRRTPWTEFFNAGPGAEVETEIPKSSVRSIIYSYGRKLGKKFVCSLVEHDDTIIVKLEDIKERE